MCFVHANEQGLQANSWSNLHRKTNYPNRKVFKQSALQEFPSCLRRKRKHIVNTSNKNSMLSKQKYGSIVNKPLIFTPPEFNSGSPIHVSSGLLTHLKEKILRNLQAIDNETSWESSLKEAVKDARKYTKRDREIKSVRKVDKRFAETDLDFKQQLCHQQTRANAELVNNCQQEISGRRYEHAVGTGLAAREQLCISSECFVK